ncbi:MAG: hypothetical protein ACOX8W_05840 [bacterium]|jgi:hypothetical protein
MKKVIVLALTLSLLAPIGCTPAPPPAAETGAARIGLGSVTSIAKSKDKTDDATATGQVDTVIAAVAFDEAGKVIQVIIDTAQSKINFDKEMKVTSDKAAPVKTKKELGNDYNMKGASSIGKEWFEQVNELEKWMVGKTVDEIKGMKVKARDEDHPAVPDVPELTSLVTISVEDFIEAVEKASNNSMDVQGAAQLGLGTEVSIAKSKDATADAPAAAQADTVMTAAAFDEAGKVVGVLIDTAQAKVSFDAEGKVTSDKAADIKTKIELGDEYGMGAISTIGKNWHEQIAELQKWMAGKTVEEIKGLKVKARDDDHPAVPDVPELTSLVTITVEDYLATVEEASEVKKEL